MSKITRIGVDLAKNLIQVHAVDVSDKVLTNRALKRVKFLAWCAECPKVVWWQWMHAAVRTTGGLGADCVPAAGLAKDRCGWAGSFRTVSAASACVKGR